MIREPTVFILGAGASRPYGLPSGAELYRQICNGKFEIPHSDDRGFDPIMEELCDQRVQDFCGKLKASGHESVDAFLEQRPEFVELGKQVIAAALIPFEDPEQLHDPDATTPELGARWYKYLFRGMVSGNRDDWWKNVAFITFNYDRSLEHFLTSALAANRGLLLQDAWESVSRIPLIHVHGCLGPYSPEPSHESRRYTPEPTAYAVDLAMRYIRVIHEGTDDSQEYQQAREQMRKAKRTVILGFGYHPTNLRRLQIASHTNGKVQGSAFGLTELEVKRITRLIDRTVGFGKKEWDTLRFLREMVELD